MAMLLLPSNFSRSVWTVVSCECYLLSQLKVPLFSLLLVPSPSQNPLSFYHLPFFFFPLGLYALEFGS